jgi:hypothetical protein
MGHGIFADQQSRQELQGLPGEVRLKEAYAYLNKKTIERKEAVLFGII